MLSRERAGIVMDLLRRIASEQQAAIICVTHDETIFDRFDRIFRLRDGSSPLRRVPSQMRPNRSVPMPTDALHRLRMLSSLVRLPLIFISGVFVPHAEMPEWGQWLSPLSPLSYSADLIRVGFGGVPYFPVPETSQRWSGSRCCSWLPPVHSPADPR